MKTFYRALLTQGKSVEWLSEKLGISHQAVYEWKLGRTNPSKKNIFKMAKILKVDISVLIKEHFVV